MKQWCSLFVFGSLAVLSVLAHDEDQPSYVPPAFVRPIVKGNPLLVDWFADANALNKKWIRSKGKKDDVEDSIAKYNGEWSIGVPSKQVIDGDMALVVSTKARHHAVATRFSTPFKFDGKPLVAQYEVLYEEGQECGGGYIKLLTEGALKKLDEFTDKTPYTIMFGPDKCGQTGKVHFIIRFVNPKSGAVTEHHAKQPTKPLVAYFDDRHTHLYTLTVSPDDTFKVAVDNEVIMSGSMLTDLEPPITPQAKIADPEDKKPEDWDERETIADPDAKKPEDWDETAPQKIEDESAQKPSDWLEEEPEYISDPKAEKPADWDEEMDGKWEAPMIENPTCKGLSGCGLWKRPMIANPNYKGKWSAPRISNPAYKGKWTAREIENPAFFEAQPYMQMTHIAALGIELWTMSERILIDNIYIGDDIDAASDFAQQTFVVKHTQELAFESAMSSNEGIVRSIVGAAEERPWLWVVYVLAVLVPVVLIAVFCFKRKTPSDYSDHKKTDEAQADDEVPNLVGDDEEPEEEAEEKTRDRSKSPSRKQNAAVETKKQNAAVETKNDLEEDKTSSQEASAASSEAEGESEEAPVAGTSSPKGKRIRQRKQD